MGHCLRVLERLWWASNGHDVAVPFFHCATIEKEIMLMRLNETD